MLSLLFYSLFCSLLVFILSLLPSFHNGSFTLSYFIYLSRLRFLPFIAPSFNSLFQLSFSFFILSIPYFLHSLQVFFFPISPVFPLHSFPLSPPSFFHIFFYHITFSWFIPFISFIHLIFFSIRNTLVFLHSFPTLPLSSKGYSVFPLHITSFSLFFPH